MKFCDFAQALAPLISDGKRNGIFVQTLLENIVTYEDEDQNPIFKKSEDTLRSYYSGKRDISEIASALVGHVDKDRFAKYLASFSEEFHERIFKALSPFWPQMDPYKVPIDASDLFGDILLEAASQKRGRKPTDWMPEEQKKAYLKESYLLDETGCRCPICGSRLLVEGSKGPLPQFECQSVIPTQAPHSVKSSCEATGFAFPEADSLASFIALCPACAAEYRSNPTVKMYEQLMIAKSRMRVRAELVDTIGRIDIEEGIVNLLNSLVSLGQEYDFAEATKNAFSIAKKISPEECLLANEVRSNVVLYYRFIEGQFRQLDAGGTLDFELTRTQVRGCFLSLEKAGLSQSEIVDSMARWLSDKTGFEDSLACRIVVAFFIQACEVFHEIAE